jgi:hypothetical protein
MRSRNECPSVHKSLGMIPIGRSRVVTVGLSTYRIALLSLLSAVLVVIHGQPCFAQSAPTHAAKPAAAKPKAAAPSPAAAPKPTTEAKTAPKPKTSAPPAAAGNIRQPPGAAPSTSSDTPKPPGVEKASAGPVDAATYVVRLRDLESRVDELKEQIRRSHTRLSLLSDTILSGGIGGAEADIVFRNEMSNAFRVVSVLFVLDGAVMKKEQDDTGELAARRTIPVYDGTLTPGDHTLQVVVVFQGHGYGVFSYLRAHKYTTKHTHSFTVKEGKLARIEATAYEKGGVTTPIDQRPNVRFTEKIVGSLDDAPAGAE